jgi:hypothetical protein
MKKQRIPGGKRDDISVIVAQVRFEGTLEERSSSKYIYSPKDGNIMD